jgi:hypothetical protein
MGLSMIAEVGGPRRATPKICGGCGAAYAHADWCDLEPCGAITSDEARTLVLGWPESVTVDLRRCANCGAVLARIS